MAEELGKIEKPRVEEFKKGRKLYFIPLIYHGEETPEDYLEKIQKYWEQVGKQVTDLESKLGKVNRIYHELIPIGGEDGSQACGEDPSRKSRESCADGESEQFRLYQVDAHCLCDVFVLTHGHPLSAETRLTQADGEESSQKDPMITR